MYRVNEKIVPNFENLHQTKEKSSYAPYAGVPLNAYVLSVCLYDSALTNNVH